MSRVDVDAREAALVEPAVPVARGGLARRIVARVSLVAMPLVAVYALLIVFESLTTSFRNRPLDVSLYYSAAAALRANPAANIYDPAVLAHSASQHAGCALWTGAYPLYPPLIAIIFEPFTALPCDQAIHYWMLCNLVLWAICTALLVYWLHVLLPADMGGTGSIRARLLRWLRGEPDTALLATMGTVALSVLAWPVLQGLLMGQVHLVLLVALLCVPLLVRREWYVAAGLVLAFAAMLKLLPALVIVYYLVRGRWRVILGVVLGMALLAGVIVLAVRPPVLVGARATFVSGAYVQTLSDNEALSHAPVWIAIEVGTSAGTAATSLLVGWAGRALLALAGLLFGAGLLLVWRTVRVREGGALLAPTRDCDASELLGYGWTICTMLLLSPLDWLHYNTWLLLPYILCVGSMLCERRAGRGVGRLAVLLVVTGMLLFLPWSLPVDGPTYAAGPYVAGGIALRPLLMLLHPVAVVLLWCVAGWMYLESAGLLGRYHWVRSMPSA